MITVASTHAPMEPSATMANASDVIRPALLALLVITTHANHALLPSFKTALNVSNPALMANSITTDNALPAQPLAPHAKTPAHAQLALLATSFKVNA